MNEDSITEPSGYVEFPFGVDTTSPNSIEASIKQAFAEQAKATAAHYVNKYYDRAAWAMAYAEYMTDENLRTRGMPPELADFPRTAA